MFKIIRAEENLSIETINILVYGEPGAGKTSLANTASKPLTLDFDKGVHRSNFRKDVLVIDSWRYINDNIGELIKVFAAYDTIVIDTVDTLLDYLGAWIIETDPKMARVKLQFYGRLKDEFSRFVSRLKTIGKDVIMIAHVKEKDEGDFRIKRPAITGGSYDRVLQYSDFVGYVYIRDNKRTIDFNPTDHWIGKNSANFAALTIPDFVETPDYFANLIQDMKNSINGQTQAQQGAIQLINDINSRLSSVKEIGDINTMMAELSGLKNGIKRQLWERMQEKAGEIGYEYDKEVKIFVAKEKPKKARKSVNEEIFNNLREPEDA